MTAHALPCRAAFPCAVCDAAYARRLTARAGAYALGLLGAALAGPAGYLYGQRYA